MAIKENEEATGIAATVEEETTTISSSSSLTPMEQRRLRSFIKGYAHATFIEIIEEKIHFKKMGSKEHVCTKQQRKEIHKGLERLEAFLKNDMIKRAQGYNRVLSGDSNEESNKDK